jgi:hypothetical protein
VGTARATLFPEVVLIVWSAEPFNLYVKVNGAVPFEPVNVINGETPFKQVLVVPEIVAFGSGLTLTVAVPVWV